MLFDPIPISRVVLGEENEALLHLAGQSVDLFMILAPFQTSFGSPWDVLWVPSLTLGTVQCLFADDSFLTIV